MRNKKEFHLWFTPEIATEISRRAEREVRPPSHIVEAMVKQALANEAANQLERTALPIIRATLGEDQSAALEELRQAIRADIQAITNKQTDRLAALLVRAGRSASLTWRLVFRLIQKQFGNAIAEGWYTEARDLAGKAMASRLDSGKEIDP